MSDDPGPHDSEKFTRDGGVDKMQSLAQQAKKQLDEEKIEREKKTPPNPNLIRLKRLLIVASPAALVLSWVVIFYYASPSVLPDSEPIDIEGVTRLLEEISIAQQTFIQAGYADVNKDGLYDYGDLFQLADPLGDGSAESLVDPILIESSEAHGFLITVDATPSEAPDLPSEFIAIAVPVSDDTDLVDTYMVGPSGTVEKKLTDSDTVFREVEID